MFSELEKHRRQPLVDFDMLTSTEMHELATIGDTVVQESCTTSVQQSMSQHMSKEGMKHVGLDYCRAACCSIF